MGENFNYGYEHDCSASSSDCAGRQIKPHELSEIKKVIGIISGKGGVGKSMVTSMLAVLINRAGYKSAVLDADITGPSIPRAFGITQLSEENELGIFPSKSKLGIPVMSVNLMLKDETEPVIWRGPVLAGAVQQFWTEVIWGKVDCMFIDMPPGTGDVPLTVLQSIPVDGLVVVSTPQTLVSMVVEKAVKMAAMMDVPIIAAVENMSYYYCPVCGRYHNVFGDSHIEVTAAKYGINTVCHIPIDPKLSSAADMGTIELMDNNDLNDIVKLLIKMV